MAVASVLRYALGSCVSGGPPGRPDTWRGKIDGAQSSGTRTSARSPQAAGQLSARASPLRDLRGPDQRSGCSHAVIKDHRPPAHFVVPGRVIERPPAVEFAHGPLASALGLAEPGPPPSSPGPAGTVRAGNNGTASTADAS